MGEGTTQMEPHSQKGLQIVVEDVGRARRQLVERGVEVSEIHEQPWGRFVYFADPDGNTWPLQQIPPRGEE
jgi:uncharacterized glyoxalase superfamily protein PhnB